MSQTFEYLLIILASYLIVGWCLSLICLPMDTMSSKRMTFNFMWIIIIPLSIILWLIHIIRYLVFIWKVTRDYNKLVKLVKAWRKDTKKKDWEDSL